MARQQTQPPVPPPRSLSESTPFSHLRYYHPDLKSLSDVREVMLPYVLQDGYFLLRKSNRNPDTYTVSVMHDKSIKHFYIFKRDEQYFLQDKFFSTIDKLIMHYRHEDVPNQEGIRHIRLVYPIFNPKADKVEGSTCNGAHATSQDNHKKDKTKKKHHKSHHPDYKQNASHRHSVDAACAEYAEDPNERHYVVQRESSATVGRSASERLATRPPMPTPEATQSDETNKLYYSSVKETNQLPALMTMLSMEDRPRCDCGLYFDEAELPRGWTMHISHEPDTEGRVFFMGPDRVTAWNLPLEVACELSQEQQDNIRTRLEKFQREHMTPLAHASRANPPLQQEHFARITQATPASSSSVSSYGILSPTSENRPIPSRLMRIEAADNQYIGSRRQTTSEGSDEVFNNESEL